MEEAALVYLWHSTDEQGAQAIEQAGFGVSHPRDSKNSSWFSRQRADSSLASRAGWWVGVDVPDEVADRYLYRFEDGEPYLDNYLIPWDVVNSFRPFLFERALS